MTDEGRISSIIEALSEILGAVKPADNILRPWLRRRRYIGSKDRFAVTEGIYAILRRRIRLSWWLEAYGEKVNARWLAITWLVMFEDKSKGDIENLFNGASYAPARLVKSEQKYIRWLTNRDPVADEMPLMVKLECPEWAADAFRDSFEDEAELEAELLALQPSAPMDMRVNPLKSWRTKILKKLNKEGNEVSATPYSPYGMRSEKRFPVGRYKEFELGLFEVQDESAQLASLLVDARPKHAVVDFCAGAGGKSLLIAAAMKNKGRIVACDVLEGRLKRSRKRLSRAGVDNVVIKPLRDESDPWVKRKKRSFDRVLTDVPCSGTGTWRRNPDMRWSKCRPDLEELCDLQARIIKSAARLVKPRGRLIYATCSMLRCENESQIEKFLADAAHADFRLMPVKDVWADVWERLKSQNDKIAEDYNDLPDTGDMLRLSPASSGNDGFFCAVLERVVPED